MQTKRSYIDIRWGGDDVIGQLTIWGDTRRSVIVSMAAVTSRFEDAVRDLSSTMRLSRFIIPETSSNAIVLREENYQRPGEDQEGR